MDRLYGDYDYTFEDVGRTHGMEWVQKYLRMKHVIVFKLSHDVLQVCCMFTIASNPKNILIAPSQFNFYDHSKLILSSNGLVVTHIDKTYKMTRWTLHDIMVQALRLASSPTAAGDMEPDQLKLHQRLMDKLKYCREVLESIKMASSSGQGEEGAEEGAGLAFGGSIGVRSKDSKMSLQ